MPRCVRAACCSAVSTACARVLCVFVCCACVCSAKWAARSPASVPTAVVSQARARVMPARSGRRHAWLGFHTLQRHALSLILPRNDALEVWCGWRLWASPRVSTSHLYIRRRRRPTRSADVAAPPHTHTTLHLCVARTCLRAVRWGCALPAVAWSLGATLWSPTHTCTFSGVLLHPLPLPAGCGPRAQTRPSPSTHACDTADPLFVCVRVRSMCWADVPFAWSRGDIASSPMV